MGQKFYRITTKKGRSELGEGAGSNRTEALLGLYRLAGFGGQVKITKRGRLRFLTAKARAELADVRDVRFERLA